MTTDNNYRGISLLSLLGKEVLYYQSEYLKRLYEWLEDNNKIAETQAGFRKGYSTTDHVFTLYAITQKNICLDQVENCMLLSHIWEKHSIRSGGTRY